MSEVELLIKAYERFVHLPWDTKLAGPQRVWFVIYDPAQERRLRPRVGAFETATRDAGHDWTLVDITDAFAEWMAGHEYREAYFEQPEDMALTLADFADTLAARVGEALKAADENTVVAVLGLGTVFGLTHASDLVRKVAPLIRGRLLGFFPGTKSGSNYRLLDARDGFDYLAVPITATSGGS